ncbi:MAG: MJ1477/TM1410 family putative glycoside hydrolase [Chloroflexota bacterium]|nr:MJ1477/TM1410 family putative glycoside hydrolase [Chloroflexota bacterium]
MWPLLMVILIGSGCIASADSVTPRAYLPMTFKGYGTPDWNTVNDWLYQLQNADLEAIGQSKYDLVVMDYSSDGTATGEYAAAQVRALRHSAGGDKLVVAYMSIGEAEDYRYYWQAGWTPGEPEWLDAENPHWPGNYKVKYWHVDWQAIVYGSPDSYLDKIIAAGFDGVYLDIIDAYEYYEEQGRATAAQEMVDFVLNIAAYARTYHPGFGVFPQNGAALAVDHADYVNAVTGIGQEDTYYGYEADDQATPPEVTAEIEGYLDVFTTADKPVLAVDYATTSSNVDDAYVKAQAKGYVPFCTVRDLDQLTINPGHEPD